MKYRVRFTTEAEDDLLRLFDHLAEQDLPAAASGERAGVRGNRGNVP